MDETVSKHSVLSWELCIVLLLGTYFIGRLCYFAFTVGLGVPPDEVSHIGIARLYAQALVGIENTPASYQFGLVTNTPYLYYFLVGKVSAVFTDPSYRFLRFANISLAIVQIFIAYRLSTLVIRNPLARILFLVMLTNTLMFSFLSASVNYDNLANLFATLSVYFLVRHFLDADPIHMISFFLSTSLGLLTKGSFLMLAPILWLVWLIIRRHDLRSDLQRLITSFRSGRRPLLVLLVVTAASLAASTSLYGTNVVRYGKVVPGCSEVIEHEQCMKHRIYARNWVVSQYRSDKMSLTQAWQATDLISHPGDRNDARRLLQNELGYKNAKPENLNILNYMRSIWTLALEPSIFGILGHQIMRPTPNDLWMYSVIFFSALLLWVRHVRFDGTDHIWLGLASVAIGYYLVLVGYYNYTNYLNSHAMSLGAQGRYLFPILIPAYLIMAEFLMRPFGRRVQLLVLLVVSAVFIANDFPYYLNHVTPDWGVAIQ